MRTKKATALSLLGCLLVTPWAIEAQAQQPAPPPGPQPAGQPLPPQAAPAQPAPAQPRPAQPAPAQPIPGQPMPGQPMPGQPMPGQPMMGPQPMQPMMGPQPMQPMMGPQAGASVDGAGAVAPAEPAKPEDEWAKRKLSLIEQNNLFGSTGVLRTSMAGSGAPGTFRVGFLADYFSASGFLCDPANTTEAGVPVTCSSANKEDSASHVGGLFTLNATVLPFLEAYANIRTYANSNTEGSPQLLQVLGDTTLGVKGFTPAGTLGAFSAGGEVQLLLLNGSGDVGVAGGATSAMFRALGTADLRQLKSPLPLRFNVNLGYKVDNSAAAVEDVEAARKRPISRIERFGLGISKVDAFQTALSAEAVFPFVQPFLEYSVDVPVNRQGYECFTNTVSRGDVCLGLSDLSDPNGSGIGYAGVPSRLGLGARVTPFQAIESASGFRGLSASLGVEIGLSGTSTFVEEVTPQAPWTLYFGLGYAYDSKERPVVQAAPPPPVEKIVEVAAPQSLVRGIVRESGKSSQPVAGAILSFQGGGQPPLATGADGRFLSRHVEPGTYTFEITAPGYKPGTCTATVNAPAPAAPPAAPAPAQPMFPGAPQMPIPPAAPAPSAPKGPSYTDIECQLEAKPRLSTLTGSVKDAASGTPVANASVLVTDTQGKELKVMSDASGNFKVEGLAPGELAIRGEANGYMPHAQSADGRAGEEARATVGLNKRPKNPLVKIQGSEIKLSDKIQFETDSAKIVGQSTPLLEEIADVLQKNPDVSDVEIQGHTDNSGSRDGNQRLSDARASAVRDWLVKAGVAGGRLKAKGYGQDRPLAPNVTEANRAKNRRVQFIINKK